MQTVTPPWSIQDTAQSAAQSPSLLPTDIREYFKQAHARHLADLELFKELIAAEHPKAPPSAEHPFNMDEVWAEKHASEKHAFSQAVKSESGDTVVRPRGRPRLHAEGDYAGLSPEEYRKRRNRERQAEYRAGLRGGQRTIKIGPALEIETPDTDMGAAELSAFIVANDELETAVAQFRTWVMQKYAEVSRLRDAYHQTAAISRTIR